MIPFFGIGVAGGGRCRKALLPFSEIREFAIVQRVDHARAIDVATQRFGHLLRGCVRTALAWIGVRIFLHPISPPRSDVRLGDQNGDESVATSAAPCRSDGCAAGA